VILFASSKPTRKPLGGPSTGMESPSTSSAPAHAPTHATHATHATHLSAKHLHENLGIDLHPAATTHSASPKSFHRVHQILTAVVTCTLP
jgi:hypothetical protein